MLVNNSPTREEIIYINTNANYNKVISDKDLEKEARMLNINGVGNILNAYKIEPSYVHLLLVLEITKKRREEKDRNNLIYIITDFLKNIIMLLQFIYYFMNGYDIKQPWSTIIFVLAFLFFIFQIIISFIIYNITSIDDDWKKSLIMVLDSIGKGRSNIDFSPK